MDAAVAIALIVAGLALGISIGALLLATRAGGIGTTGGVTSETLHRSYSKELDKWIHGPLFTWMYAIHDAVKNNTGQNLPTHPGITDPPTPPGGGE